MLKSIKLASMAAAVALAGLAYSAPSMAQVEFLIGPDGVRVRASEYCDRNPDDRRCRDYRRGDRIESGRGWDDRDGDRDYRGRGRDRDRVESFGRRCGPNDALNKAARMGVRRARVVDVDRRTIEVSGRRGDRRVYLTFGRRGNCPIIGY